MNGRSRQCPAQNRTEASSQRLLRKKKGRSLGGKDGHGVSIEDAELAFCGFGNGNLMQSRGDGSVAETDNDTWSKLANCDTAKFAGNAGAARSRARNEVTPPKTTLLPWNMTVMAALGSSYSRYFSMP
jgi:hypothetical protein